MSAIPKKEKALLHRARITANSQKDVEEYFQSKFEDRHIKKYPDWDLPRVSPAAELVKARRELTLAETELATKQAEQVARRNVMDQYWQELRQKENILRQSFIKFNKFAKENREKRVRAEHKINDEMHRQAQREEEIEEMTKKLEYMKDVRNKMEKYVKEYKMYQHFLERVATETGQFHSIAEIFSRYETLAEARAALSQTQDENLQALETTGAEMVHLTDEKSEILMGLNNKLAQLQGRYDRAKALALRWETLVSRIKATAAAKNLELTQVKTSCWNIYQQICRRKGIPIEVDRNDVEHQLIHIKRTILELKRIARVAKKKAAKEGKA